MGGRGRRRSIRSTIGVDIAHNNDKSVTLSQPKYIDKMVNNHLGSPPAQSVKNKLPCDSDLPQLIADALLLDPLHIDPALHQAYQSLVGALLYTLRLIHDRTSATPQVCYAAPLQNRPQLYSTRLAAYSNTYIVHAPSAYATSPTTSH